jgi:hypothetical protein
MAFKLIPTENDECRTWLDWTRLVTFRGEPLYDRVVMIPNQRTKRSVQTAILVALGLRKGFPDYMVLAPTLGHYGLFIEAKRRNGGARYEQSEWQRRLIGWNYFAAVCKGAGEMITATQSYFEGCADFVDRTTIDVGGRQ